MIILAFTACKIATASVCKDYELSFLENVENVTPQQCMIYGQPQLAKWVSEHPGFQIKRFKCVAENKKRLDT
jgi:hypothetical protein